MAQREVLDIKLSLDKIEITGSQSLPEKCRTRRIMKNDKLALQIKPTVASKNLEMELSSRYHELREFHLQTQNAVCSPLLSQALVRKTEKLLKPITITTRANTTLKKFQKAVNMVCIICKMSNMWKRYDEDNDYLETPQTTRRRLVPTRRNNRTTTTTRRRLLKRHQSTYRSLNFEPRNFSVLNQLPEDVKGSLKMQPEHRSDMDRRNIFAVLSKHKLFQMFSADKHNGLAKVVGYETYDAGRVVCLQNRSSVRFHFVLSGLVSRVKSQFLAEGIKRLFLQEHSHGFYTDLNETLEARKRGYSLICKTDVHLLVVEREDLEEIFFESETMICRQKLLQSIEMFSTYPASQLIESGATRVQFFANNEVVESDIEASPYIYVIKAGSCSVYMNRSDVQQINYKHVKTTSTYWSKKTNNDDTSTKFLDYLPRSSRRVEEFVFIKMLVQQDIFGLISLLPRVRKLVSNMLSEYEAIEGTSKPVNKGKTVLLSNGAECLLINKCKFMKYIDFCTTSKLFSSLDVNLYAPTLEKINSKMKWNGYKKNLVNHLTQ